MKPRSFRPGYLLIALLVAGSTLALVSWVPGHTQKSHAGFHQLPSRTDTTPNPAREKKIRDLDEALEELNNVDLQATMDKAMKEVAVAMKGIDAAKIRMEIEKAMKEIDVEKINREVANAMKEIDFEKIKRDVEQSVEKIDWEKMKKDMAEVQKIDMSKLQVEMKELQKEMEKIQPQLQKEMQNVKVEIEKAKVSIEKAKLEVKEYKEFVDGLEKDGLLDKKEPYSIRHNDGELTVNGKKVSAQVYNKYRSFLEKHKSFNIKKDKDDFDIDMD